MSMTTQRGMGGHTVSDGCRTRVCVHARVALQHHFIHRQHVCSHLSIKMGGSGESLDVAKAIESLAKASGALTVAETRQMHRACEVGKAVLQSGAAQLVARAAGFPMLSSKSADGTPITVVTRTEHTLPSGQKVKRSGRECEEYLVKKRAQRPSSSTRSFAPRAWQEL